jgi:S-adenosylmethionine decarboxylase
VYFFEGAEKRLEVDFAETPRSSKKGMLNISREKWEKLLSTVNCLILSTSSTEDCDAYVLSESSLFVYSKKILIKTCGTTTLLECLPLLTDLASEENLKIDYVTYSHKNFLSPHLQRTDYRSFEAEIDLLNKTFPGHGHILGPITGDRWFIYVADLRKEVAAKEEAEQTIEIIMSQLDKSSMKQFYKNVATEDLAEKIGISDIIPGTDVNDEIFDPCGYSMNGLTGRYYSTIHVTPEPSFSYVSYESNISVSSYNDMIKRVLNIFKPGKFIISVFADSAAKCGESNKSYDAAIPGYRREFSNTCDFDGRRSCTCSHYALVQNSEN